MTLVFYISGHGFGHATRSLELARALIARGATVIIRSRVPGWFIERSLGHVESHDVETDVGVIQIDSLELDELATARAAAAFYATFDDRVAAEAAWLKRAGATAVLSDVPPLASAAARAAGVPSIVVTNFTWDWIYGIYPSVTSIAPGVIDRMREAYAHTTLALRLPFPGGFETMPHVIDIPLIARRSQLGRARAKVALELSGTRPVVLASFGGHGARLPYDAIAEESGATLVLTDFEAASSPVSAPDDRLRCFSAADLERRGVRYPDLVAAADIVASKPGYGIVSECIVNGASLLYTSRGSFAEYPVMVAEMSRHMRTQFIAQEDVRAGRWSEAIRSLLAKPAVTPKLSLDGVSVAVEHVFDALG